MVFKNAKVWAMIKVPFSLLFDYLQSNRAIAGLFGCSDTAVSLWKKDGWLPDSRVYELKDKRPDIWEAANQHAANAA